MEEKLLSEDEKSARLLSKIKKVVACSIIVYAIVTIAKLLLNVVDGTAVSLDYFSLVIKGLVLTLSVLSFFKLNRKVKRIIGGLGVILLFLSSAVDIIAYFASKATIVPFYAVGDFMPLGLGILNLLVATPDDSFIAIKPNEKHKHYADYWVSNSALGIFVAAGLLLLSVGSTFQNSDVGPDAMVIMAFRFLFLLLGVIILIIGLIDTSSMRGRRKKSSVFLLVLTIALFLLGALYTYLLKNEAQYTSYDDSLPFLFAGLVYGDTLLAFVLVTFFASKVLPPLPPKAPKPVVHKEKAKPVVVPEHKEAAKTVATVSTDVVWTGTPKELFFFLLHYGLLNAITFGIYTPWFICHFLEFYYERSTFDGRHYAFEAGGKDLFHAGWKWVLFTALTFGIYAFWAFGHFMQWKNLHTKEVKAD